MADQQIINYGNTANDGTGDPLRDAFIKVDDNFTAIWQAGPVGSNVAIANNTISTLDTNGNLILSPDGIGYIQLNNNTIPRANNIYNLGASNLTFRAGYFGRGGISTSGNIDVAGNLNVTGNINLPAFARIDIQGNVLALDGNTVFYAANSAVAANAVFTDNYRYANGAPFIGGDYGNANVAEFLPTYTGGLAAGSFDVDDGNATGAGNLIWSMLGDTLRAPSGARWLSNSVTLDDYFESATDGFLNFSTYNANASLSSQLHLEHGTFQIQFRNGANSVFQFNQDGTASFPDEVQVAGNLVAANIVGNGQHLTSTFVDRGSDPSNWNTLVTMGAYKVNRANWSGTTGTPIDSSVYVGLLQVMTAIDATSQTFYPGTTDANNAKVSWIRNYWNGVWTPWRKIVNDDQVIDAGNF